MSPKVCIIGFGSIGEKHFKALNELIDKKNIYVFSRRKLKIKNCVNTFNELKLVSPDYFIICTETINHHIVLKKILKEFKNKVILVEKPLFNKVYSIKSINNNKIFVAYNLRFHPIIDYLKMVIKNKTFFYVDIYCHSNLAGWRKTDYKNSYSSSKVLGGGVALDLSHEIDLSYYLFGNLKKYFSLNSKISNLKINSDDILLMILKSKKSRIINLSLNFFSKFNTRKLILFSDNLQIKCDLINNTLIIIKNKKIKKIKLDKGIKDTYKIMLNKLLQKKFKNLCKYDEALKINKLIQSIPYNKI